jgi:diguanylate cyclase (GGDEF)-like protein
MLCFSRPSITLALELAIEFERKRPVVVTWCFAIAIWGLVYTLVGFSVAGLRTFLSDYGLASAVFLLMLVLCAFLRDRPRPESVQSPEDALALCAVLALPGAAAVGLMATAAILVSASRFFTPHQERGPWLEFVGDVFFHGGASAFAALAGASVFELVYGPRGPLASLTLAELLRVPLVFMAIALVRVGAGFLHAWLRGVPLVVFLRELRSLRTLPFALPELANMLLGTAMAVVFTTLGLTVFTALGLVLVAMVSLVGTQSRLVREAEAHLAELRVLNTVGRALNDPDQTRHELLEAVNRLGADLFGPHSLTLYLIPPPEASRSGPDAYVQGVAADDLARHRQATAMLAEWCAHLGRPLRLADAAREVGSYGGGVALEPPFRAWLGVPVQVDHRIQGVVCLGSDEPAAFQRQHEDLLTSLAQHLLGAFEKVRLLEVANVDALTGLKSARYLRQQLAAEFERARSSLRPLGLLMIDLDHFKAVNDRYGHEIGNIVLRHFAETVNARLRDADTAARYGGEEFTVLLPGTGPSGIAEVAERLRAGVEGSPAPTPVGLISVTASFGAACYPGDAIRRPDDLIEAADRALYVSKREGRNRVTVGAAG